MVKILRHFLKKKSKFDIFVSTDDAVRILLYADVDMNLIDGSSVWLNSLTNVLALEKKFNVTVLLKARQKTNRLLMDLNELTNVRVIEPFESFPNYRFENRNRMTYSDALSLIENLNTVHSFDCILLRGLELCYQAVHFFENPEIIIPYFTSFSKVKEHSKVDDVELISQILSRVRVVFAQTPEMKSRLAKLTGCSLDKIFLLAPMIPNIPYEKPLFKNIQNKLVYAGKFSNEYNIVETLKVFEAIKSPDYKLHIAGDKFHADLEVPEKELIAWMTQIPNVCWHKGLNRNAVSALIMSSDLGLCWRSKTIDNEYSMELSTKVLEYGRHGKPVLIRKIPIHERLLGKDYPFFVETSSELSTKIRLAFANAQLYCDAAKVTYDASHEYSFDMTISRIRSVFLQFKK